MPSEDAGIVPENVWDMFIPTHSLPKPQSYCILMAPDGTNVQTYCYGHWNFGNFNHMSAIGGDYGPEYIKILAGYIRQRKKKHFDNLIQLTGDERAGKSTMAQLLARELEPGFPLSRIVFKIKDFNEAIQTAPNGSVIIFDEAGFDLFNQEWWAKFQKNLVKKMLVIGIKELIVILALPHRMDLTAKLRDRRVKYWINVFTKGDEYERGFATFRKAVGNEWYSEIYWEGLAAFRFNKIEGPEWDEYQAMKWKFVNEVAADEYEPDDEGHPKVMRDKCIVMMLESKKFTQKQISSKIGLTQSTISNIYKKAREGKEKVMDEPPQEEVC